jgi:hypothetical protein
MAAKRTSTQPTKKKEKRKEKNINKLYMYKGIGRAKNCWGTRDKSKKKRRSEKCASGKKWEKDDKTATQLFPVIP